jgi:hypothetical protein
MAAMNHWLMLQIVLLGLSLGLTSASAQSSSTSGDCSPIVTNARGNVTITCALIANRIPVYKFQGEITQANVNEFGEFVESHMDDIIELDIWPNYAAEGYGKLYYVEQRNGRKVLSLNAPRNPRSATDGGMLYNIISSNITWANGGYVIRGFYSVEWTPGIHQGWMEVHLDEISRGELLARGRVDRR